MDFKLYKDTKWVRFGKCPRDGKIIYREVYNNGEPTDHFTCERNGCTWLQNSKKSQFYFTKTYLNQKGKKSMKTLFILLTLMLLAGCEMETPTTPTSKNIIGEAPNIQYDSVIFTLANGWFSAFDTVYYYDIYGRAPRGGFYLGNSTLSIEIEDSVKFNPTSHPVLDSISPRFTQGGGVGYQPMALVEYEKDKGYYYIRILHFQNEGAGSELSKTDEFICRVKLKVKFRGFALVWDKPFCSVRSVSKPTMLLPAWVGEVTGW